MSFVVICLYCFLLFWTIEQIQYDRWTYFSPVEDMEAERTGVVRAYSLNSKQVVGSLYFDKKYPNLQMYVIKQHKPTKPSQSRLFVASILIELSNAKIEPTKSRREGSRHCRATAQRRAQTCRLQRALRAGVDLGNEL